MNMQQLEIPLKTQLQRALGKAVEVKVQPAAIPVLGGMRPTVFIHASEFQDLGGVTDSGARIAREPIAEPPYKGFTEQRPARMIVKVTCMAATYVGVQELMATIVPTVLLGLESLSAFSLGDTPNNKVRLGFDDFRACLHHSRINRQEADDVVLFAGEMIFYLNGFLHVVVSRRGALKPPPKPDIVREKTPRVSVKKTVSSSSKDVQKTAQKNSKKIAATRPLAGRSKTKAPLTTKNKTTSKRVLK